MHQLFIFFLSAVFILVVTFTNAKSCPCADKKLCEPIKRTGGKEVFVFSESNETSHWKKYDWTKITTVVATISNPQFVCLAHENNARIVFMVSYPKSQLTNKTARAIWIKQQVQKTLDGFLDGINFDFEDQIYAWETDIKFAYTELVKETNAALKAISPFYQSSVSSVQQDTMEFKVTVDVAWAASGTGLPCMFTRCYDYKGLAMASDFLFVMDYDIVIGKPIRASANSPFNLVIAGLKQFLHLGISNSSLVLGFPWYGYRFPCYILMKFILPVVSWRGVESNRPKSKKNSPVLPIDDNEENIIFKTEPYGDLSLQHYFEHLNKCFFDPLVRNQQLNYPYFIRLLNQSTSGRLWDPFALSPYFTYVNKTTNHTFQMWYDDPQSLSLKYQIQKQYDLRGVGIFDADKINYDESPESIKERKEMWAALPKF